MGVPYQPFVEALRHFVDHVSQRLLVTSLGRHAGELVRIHPDLAVRLSGSLPPPLRSDPETERYRLFEAVTAWLAAASADDPVLLVLDDLQWATKPTLLLLRHLLRSADRMRLLVLGTYRDTELHPDHPLTELLADLRRQSEVDRLSLSGLDQGEVATFMAEAAGHDMDEDGLALARTIHGETEGNPFFVREIIRHLAESGGPSSGGRAAGPPGFRSTSWGFPRACGRWWAAAWPACPATPTRHCGWRLSSEPTSSWTWCRRRAISVERRCSPPWRKRSPPGW